MYDRNRLYIKTIKELDALFIGLILLVGGVIFIAAVIGASKYVFYSSKGEKITCPTCGHETLKMGDNFNCQKCKKPIIMHADGTPTQG